jgi:nucleoside-diphosphate-sugar epimerase
MFRMIETLKPDWIFHLAAQSYPTVSWDRPQETFDINVGGTINLFEAVKEIRRRTSSYDPGIVVACSSAEYGASLTPERVPIVEDTPLLPLHPYGVSKVAQDLLTHQYFVNDGIRGFRARIFNTTGPRKRGDVVSDFSARVARISKGAATALRVGNLNTKRAILDVRDTVEALICLQDKGEAGDVYNVSSNQACRIGDLIPILETAAGLTITTEVDKALLRSSDEPIIFGSSAKLMRDTGWKQKHALKETVESVLAYELSKVTS